MKYIRTLSFFIIMPFLIACNPDEQEPEPPEAPVITGDYGTYRYNGVEKTIVEASFHLLDSGNLLLTLVDEDERESAIEIYDFDGQGHYPWPASAPPGLTALHFYLDGDLERNFQLNHLETSSITVTDYSATSISGAFDLKLSSPQNVVQSNWTDGQFFDVPAFEMLPAEPGRDLLLFKRIMTIDSMHTRLTNTFFLETYLYASTRLGTKHTRLFRWNLQADGTVNPPYPYFGSPEFFVWLYNSDPDAEISFDGNTITTSLIDHTIFFEDLPVNEYPKPFGLPGELLLYSGSEVISFDEVDIDIVLAQSDTAVTATNQSGNVLVARWLPSNPPSGLSTNHERPGVAVELSFYTSSGQAQPDWSVIGFMQYEHVADEIVNLGFETAFRSPPVEPPTYIRLKDHPL